MDNIRDTFTLERLESLGKDKTINYAIYAFMPVMVKDKECRKSVLTHQRKLVFISTDIEIVKDVFKEFNHFSPSIQATIIFD